MAGILLPKDAPGRRVVVAVLSGLSGLIALARLHTWNEPLERDLATYAVIGHEILNGKVPYSEIWDQKPPGLHAAYALAELLAGYGPGLFYLLSVSTAVLTLLAVYRAARRLSSVTGGLWAAAFWTLLSGDMLLQANQPNAEVFMNSCLAGAVAILAGRSEKGLGLPGAIGFGVLAGLSSLFKHVILLAVLIIGIAWILVLPARGSSRLQSIRDMTVATLAAGAVWGVVSLVFVFLGSFDAMFDALFLYNQDYAGSVFRNLLGMLAPGRLFPGFLHVTAPLIALAVAGAAIAVRERRARPFGIAGAYLLGVIPVIALPGMWFPHYYQLALPPIALLGGLGCASLPASDRLRLPIRWLAGGVAVLCLLVHELPNYRKTPEEWSVEKYNSDYFIVARQVGLELATLLGPDETFYHWGTDSSLFFYSRRRPPTAVFYAAPYFIRLRDDWLESLFAQLDRSRPKLVVIDKYALHMAPDHPVVLWLQERYVPHPSRYDAGYFWILTRRDG